MKTTFVLSALVKFVQDALDAAPKFEAFDNDGRAQHSAYFAKLAADLTAVHGARIRDTGYDHKGSLGGVSASSTISMAMALHNWQIGARKRIAGGRKAGEAAHA